MFDLEVEDGWPPVAVESLPFKIKEDGFRLLNQPLFIKGLSVGDVINATIDDITKKVSSWDIVSKSNNTTIWLLRMQDTKIIESVLVDLRNLGCDTVSLEELGAYSINVPNAIRINDVDVQLGKLDPKCVAVAYPSFRHSEDP
jgi:hypothetical protein